MRKYLLLFILCALLFSCKEKQPPPVYVDVDDISDEEIEQHQEEEDTDLVVVPFRTVGGVKYVKVTVNGMGVDMILDTGCSGALISVAEANYLYQKGRLSIDDVLGVAQSQIADGSIVENMVVNLREVIIGDKIICPNVQATVSNNIAAPLLLGNGVLDRAASFTIDNENEVIIFKVL